ncbi:uncharacterized protein LOC135701996 [Ochlerotatus camptorhynchus]|uniref:uncharacterized protein LOC135701996 n=1 Tax=Ochlerotatus camptorhynchus TaxID=644619 RepID=UPI0031DE3760
MGLPDLPEQNDGDEFRMEEDTIINADVTTDDSENEFNDENEYMGYQPLNLGDNNDTLVESDDQNDSQVTTPTHRGNNSNPVFLNVDVWNAPRPDELNIELDPAKAEQILNVMAGFKLPNSSVPEWAVGIPEDRWKEELLQRIRQRQHFHPSKNTDLSD